MEATKRPCNECPYRKNAAPGYLGEASWEPELFLQQLNMPKLHPCHLTVDWEDSTVEQIDSAPVCVGALQFMNNSCKQSRNTDIIKLQRAAGKNEDVFNWQQDFIEYHTQK